MLHSNDSTVRSLLLKGSFGLERESLRVTATGNMSHAPHPFGGNPRIARDFSENQVEINTRAWPSISQVLDELHELDALVQSTLRQLETPELLWPFSNPPVIKGWKDIPIAQFQGEEASKTEYRNYLSDRYGRYKMTFSGIHFNYSFSPELLKADFALSGMDDFTAYKDALYMDLAQQAVNFGWLITAISAASPLMDASYVEKGAQGQDLYLGLSTVRCSELGYWNFFTPVLDYSSASAYAASIQSYVDSGLIKYPSELYYPVRVKPKGPYSLEGIAAGDLSHIELRMFDLNPLHPAGINPADMLFAQLFLVWLASMPVTQLSAAAQVQAAQNFKNASHFDLKTVKVVAPSGKVCSVARAGLEVIEAMEEFFAGFDAHVLECLAFQKEKFQDPNARYAAKVKKEYSGGFVEKGLALARQLQDAALAR